MLAGWKVEEVRCKLVINIVDITDIIGRHGNKTLSSYHRNMVP